MENDKIELTDDIISYIKSKVSRPEYVSESNVYDTLSRKAIDFCKDVLMLITETKSFKNESYSYKLKHILETYIINGDYISDYSFILAIKELNMNINHKSEVKFSLKQLFEAIYELLENKGIYEIKNTEKERFNKINNALEVFLKDKFLNKGKCSISRVVKYLEKDYKEMKITRTDLFKLIRNKNIKYKIEPYEYSHKEPYKEIYIYR